MSIGQYAVGSSGSFTAFGGYHGIMDASEWQQPIQTLYIPGAIGITQLLDYRKSRELSIPWRNHGFSTLALITTALDSLHALNQTLTGRVILNIGGAVNYDNCTFMGFKHGPPKYDGSGVNEWWVEGVLTWIQRAPS
jgi:hypothetical protein